MNVKQLINKLSTLPEKIRNTKDVYIVAENGLLEPKIGDLYIMDKQSFNLFNDNNSTIVRILDFKDNKVKFEFIRNSKNLKLSDLTDTMETCKFLRIYKRYFGWVSYK